jgi:hypothetical protein
MCPTCQSVWTVIYSVPLWTPLPRVCVQMFRIQKHSRQVSTTMLAYPYCTTRGGESVFPTLECRRSAGFWLLGSTSSNGSPQVQWRREWFNMARHSQGILPLPIMTTVRYIFPPQLCTSPATIGVPRAYFCAAKPAKNCPKPALFLSFSTTKRGLVETMGPHSRERCATGATG